MQKYMNKALTNQMRARIADMGFSGVLNIVARSLDHRDFLTWLMDRFNPKSMTIVVSGAKWIKITEHAIKCVLGFPSDGRDPPIPSKEAGWKALTEVAAQLFPDEPEPNTVKFNPTRVADQVCKYLTCNDLELDEDFCIRRFFMVLNNILLTPNTSSYIRNVDALWCQDLQSISQYKWCKIIYYNLMEAGKKWNFNKELRLQRPPIIGCSIFLIVSL
jgi:hypothetical protein